MPAIMISPAAAAPAPPATVLSWSGYARAGPATSHDNIAVRTNGFTGLKDQYSTDVEGRAKLKAVGSRDTDMGTFCAAIAIRGNSATLAVTNKSHLAILTVAAQP